MKLGRPEVTAVARDLWRRLRTPAPPQVSGWATRSLIAQMRSTVLRTAAGMQALMLLAVIVTGLTWQQTLLLSAGHLIALAVTLFALAGRVPAWSSVVIADLIYLADWSATPTMLTPLIFAACWQRNLSNAVPAILSGSRTSWILPVATSLTFPGVMIALRPDLPTVLPQSVLVTGLSIVLATRLGVSYVYDLSTLADTVTATSEQEQRDLAAREAARATATEDARTLHDTVINTLAAIAGGGAAVVDVEAVRRRCRDDLRLLGSLDTGRHTTPGVDQMLQRLPAVPGISTEIEIDDPDALAAAEAGLDASVRRVVRASVLELIQNAAKHSGDDRVVVSAVTSDHQVVVSVSDRGRGFDGHLRPGRGLDRSVRQRCAEVGIGVQIDTAVGRGTAVTLSVPRDRLHDTAQATAEPGEPGGAAAENFKDFLSRTAPRVGFVIAVGLAAVGLALAFSNHHGRLNPEYAMVLLVAGVTALTWATTRSGQRVPAPVAGLLVISGPIAFVLTALAVDLGRREPVTWQAIGPTGPLILLMAVGGSRRLVQTSLGLYGASAIGCALWVVRSSTDAAVVVLIAAVVGMGFASALRHFWSQLSIIGSRTVADQESAAAARRLAAEQSASESIRVRWRTAGLAHCRLLLEQIADGDLDPADPAVQQACAVEEGHLRQLTLLSPDLVQLGRWLMQALGTARRRRVDLVLRAGDTDTDARSAAIWGALLLDLLHRVEPGVRVGISVFGQGQHLRLMLVCSSDALLDAVAAHADRVEDVQVRRLTDTIMVELTAPAAPTGPVPTGPFATRPGQIRTQ